MPSFSRGVHQGEAGTEQFDVFLLVAHTTVLERAVQALREFVEVLSWTCFCRGARPLQSNDCVGGVLGIIARLRTQHKITVPGGSWRLSQSTCKTSKAQNDPCYPRL